MSPASPRDRGEQSPLATVPSGCEGVHYGGPVIPPVDLRLGEAVELGHAFVQRLAGDSAVRILFLKGPALHRQGLRSQRTSSDVDVLVDPPGFSTLCAALVAAGWHERPVDFITSRTSVHSRTFIRDGWPCDLDVHSFYPGFLAPPAEVFEALWADRVQMPFAHRLCDVPDRLGSALILALHSLRGKALEPRHRRELDELLQIELDGPERARLAELAKRTGCAATLEDVLTRLGVQVAVSDAERSAEEVVRWRRRVASGSHGAYFWIDAFRRGDGRERVAVVRRAVWPTREHLLLSRPETTDTVPGRLRGRLARWGRGIRSVPQAVRAITRYR
ncbi:MAG: nucleotidyltransferase family protein [Microbacterium sp.]|uniref:nucleotidyltransferase family protein n=1 Tax=Microbacterium sp. TaxID=51671 RepID=UPI003F7DAD49